MTMTAPLQCHHCGSFFHAASRSAKFCSNACKQAAYRERCAASFSPPTPLVREEGAYRCADITPEIHDWFAEDLSALHNQLDLLVGAADLTPEVQDLALQLQESAIRAYRLSLRLVAITAA